MKTKISFAVTLLYIVEFVVCADDEYLTSPPSQADSKLTITTSIILSLIDLIACLYILGRTYWRWKKNDKKPIPMELRFPFYIASIESSISILQIIAWSNPTPNGASLHPLCNAIGTFSMFLIAFTMNVVTFISFINWCKVKRGVDFNSGRYDYIIFLIAIGFSVFYTLLGVGKYGKVQYWCVVQPDNRAVLYIVLAITLIHMISLLFFYFDTRLYMKSFKTNQSSFNGQDLPTEDNEKTRAKKLLSYTLVFGAQFAIILLYILVSMGSSENTGYYLLRILGITIGGLLVAVQYILNEDWKDKPIPTSSSQKHLSNLSHLSRSSLSIRDSISQNSGFRLPFTKIQVEVVRQQTTTQQDDWNV